MPDHPHADATYCLKTQADGSFVVEVTVPETQLVKVTGFDTRGKAEAWIERHKANVATGTLRASSPNWTRTRATSR